MKLIVLLSVVALAYSSPVPQEDSVMRLLLSNVMHCMNGDMGICLKEQALKATERMGTFRNLKITEGITLINNGAREAKALDLSTDPEQRKTQVTAKLWESTTDLLKNSELELSFPADDDEQEQDSSRALESESRGKKKEKKKKIKMLLPLLMLAKVKAAALVVLSIAVIAASLFKLAWLAKLAFLAKAVIFIKQLLQKKHQMDDHGWATAYHAEPAHEEHHGHGWESSGNGWGRSGQAQNMAYSAYAKTD